jgi:hypothetical protein
MLPRKTGKPIAFKCTEELRQQTEAIADSLGESLSDYVRKAVEQRNAQMQRFKFPETPGMAEKPEIIPAKEETDIDQWSTANSVDQAIKAAEKVKHSKSKQEFKTFFKK